MSRRCKRQAEPARPPGVTSRRKADKLNQTIAEELAGHKRLVLLCGRYEGIDQRAIDILRPDEISIGDFILGGGEVAAMVVIDAVVRLVPGVLGDEESNRQDSFSGEPPLLEFPQYTRPREYRGLEVPEVLHHRQPPGNRPLARSNKNSQRTRERRADLLATTNEPHRHEEHEDESTSQRIACSFVHFVPSWSNRRSIDQQGHKS